MIFKISDQISKSYNLNSEFYLNPEYFVLCKEKIFAKSWQFIGDQNIFKKNNIYPFLLLEKFINEPLVCINRNNTVQCYSNVCTHRAHIVAQNICNNTMLRCRYHGRKYQLDGTFHSMPGFDGIENFPTKQDNLTIIPTKVWKNFIFVSLDNKFNIDSILGDIETRIPNFPFNHLKYDHSNSQEWIINAHWALYCENYLEGFHVPYIHEGLSKEIDFNKYETILLEGGVLQIAYGKNNTSILNQSDSKQNNIYGLYYWIFPNIMFNFYAWGLSINIIEPISNQRSKIRFLSYSFESTKQPQSGDDNLNKIELEDQSVILNVQKGIQSRFYKAGRYSPEHEKGVYHFHKILSEHLNFPSS